MILSPRILQAGLLLISALGLSAGIRLSISHFKTGEVCPMLGPLPACYAVFMGYGLVFISAFFYKYRKAPWVFYSGWLPVFLLAFSGVVFELTQGDICPPGAGGIPQCFFSLAMAVIAGVLFWAVRRKPNQ